MAICHHMVIFMEPGCQFVTLRLSDNVSHLGVFFGLLSAFSAGATYVVIRFLGTAKAEMNSLDSLKLHEFVLGVLKAGATYVRFTTFCQVDWASVLLAQALGQIVISPFALVESGQELRHSRNEV